MDEGLVSRLSLSSTSSTTAGSPGKEGALHWAELSGFCAHFGLVHCIVALPQTQCKLNLPALLGCRNEDCLLAPSCCKPNEPYPGSVCQGRLPAGRNTETLYFSLAVINAQHLSQCPICCSVLSRSLFSMIYKLISRHFPWLPTLAL